MAQAVVDYGKTTEKSIEEIARGFPVDADRYSRELCEKQPVARRLADRYYGLVEEKCWLNAPDAAKNVMRDTVMDFYRDLTHRIEFIECAGEPYFTAEDMARDVEENQRMFVRLRSQGPFVGNLTQEWRVIHDVHAHIWGKCPFTFSGELAAFGVHTVGKYAFPPSCFPFIWNNVVLENTFRLVYGHFLHHNRQGGSSIVYDAELFGPHAFYFAKHRA